MIDDDAINVAQNPKVIFHSYSLLLLNNSK
jgi:hypothetical protein